MYVIYTNHKVPVATWASLVAGQLCSAKTRPNDFCTPALFVFGKTLTRPSRADPGQFCTIRSGPSLKELNWMECRKSDPAYMIRPNCGCMLTVTKMFPNGIWHVYWILKRWWCRATALDVEHQVKHSWTWSPRGWVTAERSPESKILVDSTKVLQ